jgi:germination protein YpeB
VVWPYLVLSVALVGATVFGAYQTQQKNRLAIDSENKYMSAFHKLKWTSENIEERTSRLMATNDPRLQESLLADLRVYSAQAVEHMATLPFLTSNTPRVQNFLNTMRERSDVLHDKVNRGGTLSADDWAQLQDLRRQSVFFEGELGNMLGIVGNGMIRWRDTVRVTGPTQSGSATTPITKSVAQLDKALTPPPGEQNAAAPQTAPLARPKVDPGAPVDPATAIAAVKKFLDAPLKAEPVITGRSDPADQNHEFSLYFIDGAKANGTPLNMGVSIHGGHVIYMIDGRPVTDKRFKPQDLVPKAGDMLRKWGYQSAEFISMVENDGTLVMDFAPMEQGVSIHTDRIKISLAMDNAELVGFDAKNYWINRHDRKLGKPKLTAAEALKRIAPKLKPEGQPDLAVVADRMGNERLTYEVKAALEDQRYLIYVDAKTGEEVDVQRVVGDPAPPSNEGQQARPGQPGAQPAAQPGQAAPAPMVPAPAPAR